MNLQKEIANATIRFLTTVFNTIILIEDEGTYSISCAVDPSIDCKSDSLNELAQTLLHKCEASVRGVLVNEDKVYITHTPTLPIFEFRDFLRLYKNDNGEEVFDIYTDTLRRTVQAIETHMTKQGIQHQ